LKPILLHWPQPGPDLPAGDPLLRVRHRSRIQVFFEDAHLSAQPLPRRHMVKPNFECFCKCFLRKS
jgi:hypothetical protein